jgi:hypothetical protein
MRHEQLENHGSFDIVDVASLWPNALELEPSIGLSPAAPDVPVAAGGLMIASYAALLGAFPLLIAHDASSGLAIVIGAFYLAMFFAVPFLFFKVEKDASRRPELSSFLERGMQTATGHISGKGALVQMLVVPVLLTFGVLAMGIAYLVI